VTPTTDPLPFGTLQIDDVSYDTRLTRKFLHRKPYAPADASSVTCVIPGVVQEVYVREGQTVRPREPLLVIEAMKMQNDIIAPAGGVVRKVHVRTGQQVAKGELLVELG
jgi:biotin carboxyl carrier protein